MSFKCTFGKDLLLDASVRRPHGHHHESINNVASSRDRESIQLYCSNSTISGSVDHRCHRSLGRLQKAVCSWAKMPHQGTAQEYLDTKCSSESSVPITQNTTSTEFFFTLVLAPGLHPILGDLKPQSGRCTRSSVKVDTENSKRSTTIVASLGLWFRVNKPHAGSVGAQTIVRRIVGRPPGRSRKL